MPHVVERDTPLGRWAKALLERAHPNVAIVAFANKLARIAWAVLRRGERFVVGDYPWRRSRWSGKSRSALTDL